MVKIFALFQAFVGNFHTIPLWKVVGTLYLDISYVNFNYQSKKIFLSFHWPRTHHMTCK